MSPIYTDKEKWMQCVTYTLEDQGGVERDYHITSDQDKTIQKMATLDSSQLNEKQIRKIWQRAYDITEVGALPKSPHGQGYEVIQTRAADPEDEVKEAVITPTVAPPQSDDPKTLSIA